MRPRVSAKTQRAATEPRAPSSETSLLPAVQCADKGYEMHAEKMSTHERCKAGARSLAIAHVAIVLGSTGEPLRGPDGCGIHVGHGNTAPDTVSKSEKARL